MCELIRQSSFFLHPFGLRRQMIVGSEQENGSRVTSGTVGVRFEVCIICIDIVSELGCNFTAIESLK